MESVRNPSVGIVIINWNSFGHTHQCLLSLKKVTYPNFKIFIVDNGSSDGSGRQLKEEHGDFVNVIFHHENAGFAGGNNIGIAEVLRLGFDYVMLLNNDTESEPDFLNHLVKKLEENPSFGAVQPKFFFLLDKTKIWNAGGKFIPFLGISGTIGYNQADQAKFNHPKILDWITGCGFMVSTAIVKKVGMLNEKFFIYYEDVDWSFRIRNAGYKLAYEPKSVVYHEAGMAHKSNVKKKEGYVNPFVHYLRSRNQIWLLRKYTPWYFAPTVTLFMMVKNLAIMAYFVFRKRFKKLTFAAKGLKEGIFHEGI
jgi:GT2 family glycosyltransferase